MLGEFGWCDCGSLIRVSGCLAAVSSTVYVQQTIGTLDATRPPLPISVAVKPCGDGSVHHNGYRGKHLQM